MVRRWWRTLRNSPLRDVPFVFLGFLIGYNADCTCVVKGNSMFPTLHPGEHLFFLPASFLALKKLLGKPLVYPGDVVVVKISDNLSVCKRIVRASTDADEAETWGQEYYRNIEPDPSYFSEEQPTADSDWFASLSKSTRSHDWQACIDRVPSPSAWLWLEGDNTSDSFDSRNCGPIPLECLRGKVVSTLYPRPRFIASAPAPAAL